MVTNMNGNTKFDDNDDHAGFKYKYRDTVRPHLKQGLYNKKFSLQDQGKCDQLILSRTELNVGQVLLIWGVLYLIMFMIMIIPMDWIILFAVQRYFLRLEN